MGRSRVRRGQGEIRRDVGRYGEMWGVGGEMWGGGGAHHPSGTGRYGDRGGVSSFSRQGGLGAGPRLRARKMRLRHAPNVAAEGVLPRALPCAGWGCAPNPPCPRPDPYPHGTPNPSPTPTLPEPPCPNPDPYPSWQSERRPTPEHLARRAKRAPRQERHRGTRSSSGGRRLLGGDLGRSGDIWGDIPPPPSSLARE